MKLHLSGGRQARKGFGLAIDSEIILIALIWWQIRIEW